MSKRFHAGMRAEGRHSPDLQRSVQRDVVLRRRDARLRALRHLAPRGPVLEMPAATRHSFGGSFSAGSKPIFASKCAFFSIFQSLQENIRKSSSRKQILQNSAKNSQNIANFLAFLSKFCKKLEILNFSKIRKIFAKFCRIISRILQKFVGFEKLSKMLYRIQHFVKSLQIFDEI